ncbi:MAG: ABC transporter ATP-binding protein [Deltaproteobacteria bacterium]|nr:ABC transporter ATP-binding protein [Deltaproteobacteria bacterium]
MMDGWARDGEGRVLDLRLLARLWPYLRPHGWAFVLGFVLMTFSSVAKLAGPYVLKLAIDGPIARREPRGLWLYAGLFLAAQAAEALLEAAQTLLVRIRGQDVLRALRSDLFAKAQRLPSSYFDATPGGKTLSRITSDVAVLSDFFSSGLVALVGDALLLAGILVLLFRLDPRLAVTAYVTLPLLLAASEIFRRQMRAAYRQTREKTSKLMGKIQEYLRGFEVLRLFAAEPWAEGEFDVANAEHRDAFLRSNTLHALFFPLVELLSSVTLALVLWKGGREVIAGAATLGGLVAFFEYLQKFFRPLRDLSEKYNILQASMASIEKISDFLDLPEEASGGGKSLALEGRLDFVGIEFAYDGGPPVLRGVDVAVAPGEVVALVGPTGCGKTTFVHLLLGLYRPRGGRILVDGVDLAELDPGTFREQVALVPQDVFLFDDTVVENVRLGRPGVSREAAVEALRAVGLGPSLELLPKGYDTPVLEEGALLSSGQRQLVAFARALAGDPKILVLDEATSEVDQATEGLIEEALERLFQGRTTLVVAHRLATVRRSDRVVLFAKGRVAEEGTHEELLARGGLYRTLYELQFRGEAG